MPSSFHVMHGKVFKQFLLHSFYKSVSGSCADGALLQSLLAALRRTQWPLFFIQWMRLTLHLINGSVMSG